MKNDKPVDSEIRLSNAPNYHFILNCMYASLIAATAAMIYITWLSLTASTSAGTGVAVASFVAGTGVAAAPVLPFIALGCLMVAGAGLCTLLYTLTCLCCDDSPPNPVHHHHPRSRGWSPSIFAQGSGIHHGHHGGGGFYDVNTNRHSGFFSAKTHAHHGGGGFVAPSAPGHHSGFANFATLHNHH